MLFPSPEHAGDRAGHGALIPPRRVRPALALAVGAALAVLLAGPPAAAGHSNLVSSSPGAGQVVAAAPGTLDLVFSEPLDPRYTSLDLAGGNGPLLLQGAGAVDGSDPRQLVVAKVPHLADGTFTIFWRAVSAADGHVTTGSFDFGVGAVALPGAAAAAAVPSAHDHDEGLGAGVGIGAATLVDGGLLLAFGLWLFGGLVWRPVHGRLPSRFVAAQAAALCAAALGAALTAVIAVGSLPTAAAVPGAGGLPGYLLGSRTGSLLVLEIMVAGAGAVIAAAWLTLARGRHPAAAAALAGLAAVGGFVLHALASHQAVFATPVPAILDIVHLAAAGTWLAGLLVLVVVGLAGPALARARLAALVPRFSALALAAAVLLAATGIYAAWHMTGDFTTVDDPYSALLALKVATVAIAFALGALNLRDGGRADGSSHRFDLRVETELVLIAAVVVMSVNLAGASPPGEGAPLELAPAATTVGPTLEARLFVAPGTAGPTQLWATLARSLPTGATVGVELSRLDQAQGTTRVALAPVAPAPPGLPPAPVAYTAGGLLLPAGSRWDAVVVVQDAPGVQVGRERFSFALAGDVIATGLAGPPVDPALLVGFALLAAAVLGAGFWVGGGRPPWIEPGLGRRMLVAGSAVSGLLGLLVVLVGPG